MRGKTKNNRKEAATTELRQNIAEILVAHHAYEPYIIAFRYTGDNLATHSLGTIFGFFEIETHDEDAAYVVNFLASVVKKEYFANVRRGASESFESALHKANVALAELVQHGNISWLGHLNGAIGILVKDTLHFSVTGDGNISLMRDGSFRSISDGLTDKLEEPHPLKTFVEIASGSIEKDDRVLFYSPSLLTLFTPQDIERAAHRFSPEAFEQFLRTALVNELDRAALILIHCTEIQNPLPRTNKSASLDAGDRLRNVFSEAPFNEAASKREESLSKSDIPEADFVDSKTGHIYVQGDISHETRVSPWEENLGRWTDELSSAGRRFKVVWLRSSKKTRKFLGEQSRGFGKFLSLCLRASGRKCRVLWHRAGHLTQKRFSQLLLSWRRSKPNTSNDALPYSLPSSAPRAPGLSSPLLPRFFRWNSFLHQFRSASSRVFDIFSRFQKWFSSVSSRVFMAAIIIAILSVGIGTFFSTRDNISPEITPETPEAKNLPAPWPPTNEKNPIVIETIDKLQDIPTGKAPTSLLFLGDSPFLVATDILVDLTSQKSTPLPTSIQTSTAMPDLRALFLYTVDKRLFMFTPSNGKLSENDLPLPNESNLKNIGSFLTYLYAVDGLSQRIYRFPRENTGFGTPLNWLREDVSMTPTTRLAVNENLLLWDKGSISSLTRGKVVVNKFEAPSENMQLVDVAIGLESNRVFGLDPTQKRILVWDENGALLQQYYSQEFEGASHFALSPDERSALFINQKMAILRFQLP